MKRSVFSSARLLVAGGLLLGAAACSPNPLDGLSTADSQVFITNHDRSVDFKQYDSYSMADSVRVVDNQQTGFSDGETSLAMLNRIAQNLDGRGYTRVVRTAKPDLAVNVTYVRQTQTGVTVTPGLWNDPFYDPFYWGYGAGFGGGGFFYPTYYQYYQVSESYWVVELLDLKNVPQNNNQVKVVWSAQVRGGGLLNDAGQLVNALFAQSPYLRRQ